MSQDASEVYTRLLLPKGHGCPIWCPEPDENLPPEVREKGVGIGHVGRVMPSGGFDPLFNICAVADDPINCDGVPQGFEPLILQQRDITFRSRYHNRGSHVCSEPLERRQIEPDLAFERDVATAVNTNAGYRFTCSSTTEGAVLLMPDGASRKDLRGRKASFREYAIQNALRWYQFANQHLDREMPNGSLILVTGCDMASSWGIASFSDISEDVVVELNFTPSYRDNRTLSYSYSWQTNVSATVRTSPGYEPTSAFNPAGHNAQNRLWNQQDVEGVQSLLRSSFMASESQNYRVDASHGTFTDVGGNQIYNITNNVTLPVVGDRPPVPASAQSTPENRPGESQMALDWPTTSTIAADTTSASNAPQPEADESMLVQNQCVFVRGFRIAVREGIFAAAFRGPLEISSVNDATPEDIFGSRSGFAPFSPSTGHKRSWFGGSESQTSSPKSSKQRTISSSSEKVEETILEPISTTSEPYHPSDTINRYLLDRFPDATIAITHDDDWISLMREDDDVIPEEQELIRRLCDKYAPITSTIPRENIPYPQTGNDEEFQGVYLRVKEMTDGTSVDTVMEDISLHVFVTTDDVTTGDQGEGIGETADDHFVSHDDFVADDDNSSYLDSPPYSHSELSSVAGTSPSGDPSNMIEYPGEHFGDYSPELDMTHDIQFEFSDWSEDRHFDEDSNRLSSGKSLLVPPLLFLPDSSSPSGSSDHSSDNSSNPHSPQLPYISAPKSPDFDSFLSPDVAGIHRRLSGPQRTPHRGSRSEDVRHLEWDSKFLSPQDSSLMINRRGSHEDIKIRRSKT